MEKKTPTEILVQFTDPEKDYYSVADIIQAMHEYAAQETANLITENNYLKKRLKAIRDNNRIM